ncbi:MAG: hypothetical protein J5565_01465 [Muribaculaceae bacterium]|nr:hypothetical protein [Muribaculaceae bacterium]
MKEFLSMSRHERRGALVVLALIVVVVAMLWAASTYRPSPSAVDKAALEQWATQVDSARQQAAVRDSMAKASRTARVHRHKSHDSHGDAHKKGSKKSPSTPKPRPQGLPSPVPHIQ